MSESPKDLRLVYTIVCEDVRIEMTRNLSLMGILHVIQVPKLPVMLLKVAVVNHWRGRGRHLTESRILTPDRARSIAASHPSPIDVPEHGGADNVTVFTNVTFDAPGAYVVQTLVDSSLFAEHVLPVVEIVQQGAHPIAEAGDDVIN
jgi:hypothetical protein